MLLAEETVKLSLFLLEYRRITSCKGHSPLIISPIIHIWLQCLGMLDIIILNATAAHSHLLLLVVFGSRLVLFHFNIILLLVENLFFKWKILLHVLRHFYLNLTCISRNLSTVDGIIHSLLLLSFKEKVFCFALFHSLYRFFVEIHAFVPKPHFKFGLTNVLVLKFWFLAVLFKKHLGRDLQIWWFFLLNNFHIPHLRFGTLLGFDLQFLSGFRLLNNWHYFGLGVTKDFERTAQWADETVVALFFFIRRNGRLHLTLLYLKTLHRG